MATRYNIDENKYKNIDMNLFFGLINVDEEFGTNYSDDYINGTLNADVTYNNNKLFRSKKLSISDKLKQYIISLKQKKFINANIKNPSPVPIITTVVTLGVLSIFSLTGHTKSEGMTDDNIYAVSTEDTITTEEATEATTELKEQKKMTSENRGFKIGDKLRLVYKDDEGNVTKSYNVSSDINGKNKKSTDTYDCDYFKISAIYAFLDGNNVESATLANNSDLTTNELYRKYGSKVDLYLDFDGYNKGEEDSVYESIGLLNIDEIVKYSEKNKRNIAMSKAPKDENSNVGTNNITGNNATNSTDTTTEFEEKITTEEKNTEVAKQEATTEEKKDERIYINVDKNIAQLGSSNKKENMESEIQGIGINDKVKLVYKDSNDNVTDSLDLTEDAWGNGKTVSASKINCDYFKISYVAVYRGSEVLTTIKVDSKDANVKSNELYEKYGKDIDIAFNFDAYNKSEASDECVCKYVGWLNINQIKHGTKNNEMKSKNSNEKVLTYSSNN